MSNIKNARMVKEIIDMLSALTAECSEATKMACNAYCDALDNKEKSYAYVLAFSRNISNKVHGLKNILNEIHNQAQRIMPEETPVGLESNAKPWNKGHKNATD